MTYYFWCTPGSINRLFSNLFMEFWRGMLGDVRDYSADVLGGIQRKREGNIAENYALYKAHKSQHITHKPIHSYQRAYLL